MKAFRANGTIRVSRFVSIDASDNNSVLESNSGDKIAGISQEGGRVAPIPSVTTSPVEAAQAGENVNVYHKDGDDCLLRIGSGGCTAGGYLKADNDGNGVALAGSGLEYYGAQALETAAEGSLCRVVIRIGSITTP